jgi:hypothetical protein
MISQQSKSTRNRGGPDRLTCKSPAGKGLNAQLGKIYCLKDVCMQNKTPQFENEIKKFLVWCALVATGLLVGGIAGWLLAHGYRWPAGILGTIGLVGMAYGSNGWCGGCYVIYGGND